MGNIAAWWTPKYGRPRASNATMPFMNVWLLIQLAPIIQYRGNWNSLRKGFFCEKVDAYLKYLRPEKNPITVLIG